MGKKVTIQDIADSLGLSRNTVSKALNNTGVLADDTRRRILEKAAEMGYSRFIYVQQEPFIQTGEVKELALITQNMPYGSHFGTFALNTFQEKISQNNFRLSMFPARDEEIRALQLPLGLDKDNIEGIVCMELFDPDYIEMLGSLGLPLLFVDTAYDTDFTQIDADFLLMENHASVFRLTDTLIQNGFQRLAFAGDCRHCRSFFERYQGFADALRANGLSPVNTQFSAPDTFSDSGLLAEAVKRLLVLPDAFICANDFVAVDLIRSFKKQGIRVPEDVRITGFDNAAESRIIEPHLTTVDIPSSKMGYIAADMLLSRIADPEIPYRITHVRTTVKYRESTGVLKI
ncbi:MAG TPA: LacI family DNA-binding transcriptional regulator [Candidatus Mediterraneibacter cottocaccae]|nr:LacI family DNA-binding transcriptional regulator [Candidatus Mediterraneibacter cottocaccae]